MNANPHPAQYGGGYERARQALLHTSAAIATCLALIVAVVVGTGWLYLLRHLHGLAFGPTLKGALPLQQLAGDDAQPLGRMVVAWVPTGLALGIALTAATRLPRLGRGGATAVGSALLLLASSAVSDAVAENDAVRSHISTALSSGGVWLSVALLTAGVLIAPPWSVRRRGGAVAASRWP